MTGSKKRHNRGQRHSIVFLCIVLFASCENPMVNYVLGERPDTSPVALWNGTWYYSLQEVIDAIAPGLPEELIQIRRDITSASTMGSGCIVLGGRNIRLEPYLPERPRITIRRWSPGAPVFLVDSGASLVLGDGITINGAGRVAVSALVELEPAGSFTMEGGSVVTGGRNSSGLGGGVSVAPGGNFTMKDSAIVSDTDVYLAYDPVLLSAKVNFTGALTAFPSIACITPGANPSGKYIDGLEVLTGDRTFGAADNYKHLDVTPEEVPAWGGPRYWRVNSTGHLENVIARRMINGVYEYYTSLSSAFSSTPAPSFPTPRYIELISNVDLDAITLVEPGHYIDLSVPAGSTYTLKRTVPALASSPLIRIQESASLTLGAPAGSALIIDGGAKWSANPAGTAPVSNSGIATSAPLIELSGAGYAWSELVLNDRVVLENNDRTGGAGSRNGGAVFIEQGSFTMNGGTITHNRCAGSGGGIYFGLNLANVAGIPPPRSIKGGSISENHALKSGGGISLAFPPSVTDVEVKMSGGEITGNRASGLDSAASSGLYGLTGYGGGVFIPDLYLITPRINKFIMSGGRISGNISDSGLGNGVVMDGANNPEELFELSGAAYIDYSDDVLLHYLSGKYCYITLNGTLSAPSLKIRLNLDHYPASPGSRQVLSQVLSGTISATISAENLLKFEVGAGVLGANGWITMP